MTTDVAAEVAAFKAGSLGLDDVSSAAQEALVEDSTTWLRLAQVPFLMSSVMERLAREGDQLVLSQLAYQDNLSLGVQLLVVERAEHSTLTKLARHDDLEPVVGLRLAEMLHPEILELLAGSDEMTPDVHAVIAQHGSLRAKQFLALAPNVTSENLTTLSLEVNQELWIYVKDHVNFQLSAEVGYHFAVWHYLEFVQEYREKQGVPLDEWTALGETWHGSIAGLAEAWHLTKR